MLLKNGVIRCYHSTVTGSFQPTKTCLLLLINPMISKKFCLEKSISSRELFSLKYRSISTVTEALSVLKISSSDKKNDNEQYHHQSLSQQRFESNHKNNNNDYNTLFPISEKRQHLPLHEQVQPPATLSRKEIRLAYLHAAKESHPDSGVTTATTNSNNEEAIQIMNEKFNKVTQAYEYLIQYYCGNSGTTITNIDSDDNWGITMEEEIDFNNSCLATLGLSAEIVEESKQDPGFRQWLMGNTDSAYLWRNFLACHGGLAPKLRPRLLLEPSTDYMLSSSNININKKVLRRRR